MNIKFYGISAKELESGKYKKNRKVDTIDAGDAKNLGEMFAKQQEYACEKVAEEPDLIVWRFTNRIDKTDVFHLVELKDGGKSNGN